MKPFELDCDSPWLKALTELEWSQSLDSASRLQVRFALSAKDRMELGLANLPSGLSFKCGGKALFKGGIYSAKTEGLNLVEIEYRDRTDLLERTYESEFVKGQRLQDFLNGVAGIVGLRAKFLGKLSHDLPGLDLGGRSYFQHLQQMSADYGFHFVENSTAGELVFIGMGAYREKVSVDKPIYTAACAKRTTGDLFQAAEVMGFDSQEGRSSKQEIGAPTLYEDLGFLKGASFETRSRWKTAQGRMETVVAAGKSADKHRQSLTARLSKRSVGSDTFCLETREWLGFPGDRIEWKGAHDKSSEGAYLVAAVRTRVASACPLHETTLVRA